MERTERAPLRTSALTLLLTVTALCLAALAVLALVTARPTWCWRAGARRS